MSTERQARWDRRYLVLADLVGDWSKDPSTKVGAVLVRRNNSVAATGFNGFPPGHDDSPELYLNREYKYRHVVHAEVNALNFANPHDAKGGTLYTSFPICPACIRLAAVAGVQRVVCRPLRLNGRTQEWIDEWVRKLGDSRRFAQSRGMELLITEDER